MAKPVLLVVDDDLTALQCLRSDLERAYGQRYRILTATSEREALEAIRRLKNENESLALVLANMSGVEFLENATALFPNAKRLLLASYGETEAAVRAIQKFRIDDYLIKPCQPPEQHLYPVLNDLLLDWETNLRAPIEGLRVIGGRFSPRSHETRDFLVRNCVPFQWLDIERDEEARRLLENADDQASRLPIVLFPDGSQLTQPTNAEVAKRIGLKVRPEAEFYDLVIVGGGPSGLAGAVYGASEGLRTVMVERHAPGGQAGLSPMIENYLGFPAGLSGADMARRAVAQAKKFKVEIVSPQVVSKLSVEGSLRMVTLNGGLELRCHVVLLATGVEWRRLDVPGLDKLIGAGVYYGGTIAEAFFCRDEDVYIVGGANSAGQAALSFSRYARQVTMLVRGKSLSESMSRYLIEQIGATKNIDVRLQTTVVEAHGDERLESITIFDAGKGKKETTRTNALFIFIGAQPQTEWLEGVVETDDHGFILTGPDLARLRGDGHFPRGWSLNRDPFWLECSRAGVFAAGDVRHGSVKRVASGVGEGATAVQFIHQYLASGER